MNIDIYSACPVHADKKIKFCCGKEIAAELQQVVVKFQARQEAAALEALDRLIDRVGPKDCLMSFKVKLLSSLGRLDEASQANQVFLNNNPDHPLGMELEALLLAKAGKTSEAFDALQDAMDNLPGAQIPVGFSTAFLTLAFRLANEAIWSARAHAGFAMVLKPDDDTTSDLYYQIVSACESLILKNPLSLSAVPTNEPEWKKKYENALKANRRGQFRKAISLVRKALEIEPNSPFLKLNYARVVATSPNIPELRRAWQAVADDDSFPLYQRVEAELITQLYSEFDKAGAIPIENVEFEFDVPVEDILIQIDAQPRLVDTALHYEPEDDSGPPPRSSFLVLDRPQIQSTQGKSANDIPIVKAQGLIFGKQSDRRARIELVIRRKADFDDQITDFVGLFSSPLEKVAQTTIGETYPSVEQLERQWHLPAGIGAKEFSRLEAESQLQIAREVLPDLKLEILDNRSLREVAQSPQGKIKALAAITRLRLSLDGRVWIQQWSDAIHQAIGLDPIPVASCHDVEKLSGSTLELFYSEFASLPSTELLRTFLYVTALSNLDLIRRIAEVALSRPDDDVLKPYLGSIELSLAHIEADDDLCFERIKHAKQVLKANGQSLGEALVTEFEQRIIRGRIHGLRALFVELNRNHMQEEAVVRRFSMILQKYGLLTSDGRVMLPPDSPVEPQARSGLWTPDQELGVSSEESPSASKLWVPGQ